MESVQVQAMLSSRQQEKIIHDSFTYTKDNKTSFDGKRLFWVCDRRTTGCKGRIHTKSDKNRTFLQLVTQHSCSKADKAVRIVQYDGRGRPITSTMDWEDLRAHTVQGPTHSQGVLGLTRLNSNSTDDPEFERRLKTELVKFFPELDMNLIDQVRSIPELYDKSEPNYKNNVRKGEIWNYVGEVSGIGDGEAAAKRWRSIRDQFLKRRKCHLSGKMPTPFMYAEDLEFLIPHLEEHPDSNNSSTLSNDRPGRSAPSAEEIDEIAADNVGAEETVSDDELDMQTTSKTSNRKRKLPMRAPKTEFKPALKHKMKLERNQNHLNLKPLELEDEESAIGRSVANFMRKLTERKKAEFRIELEQLKLKYVPADG